MGCSSPLKKGHTAANPHISVHVLMYCGQTAGWINMLLCNDVGLGPGHTVLDGDVPSSATPKGTQQPPCNVRPVCCVQTAGWIQMPLGRNADLGPGDIVLDGDPAPHRQFSAHIYCGQTAGWIKMPLGTEVGLGPGYIVLDGDSAPSKKGAQQPPLFGPCLLWPNSRPSQQLLSSCSISYVLFFYTVRFWALGRWERV